MSIVRMRRIKPVDRAVVYHCMSRVVGGQFLLGNREKEFFRKLLWKQAAFCGVQVLGYCIMSNHFHVLIKVPAKIELSDEVLLSRLGVFYGKKHACVLEAGRQLKDTGCISSEFRHSFLSRMGDISVFCKELKQRFSTWYNRNNDRFGTLWAERFRSVLVEETPSVLVVLSAYIDLNPVRAGIVEDPESYRYCGFAEAVAGSSAMRHSIGQMFPPGAWRKTVVSYRMYLMNKAGPGNAATAESRSSEEVYQKMRKGAELSINEVLLLRIRYFRDGVFIGSAEFVDHLFDENRERFGPRRKGGARPMKQVFRALGLHSVRDLRKGVLT